MNVKATDVFLHVKSNHRAYIYNKSNTVVNLRRGMTVAGFGKGRYKLAEAGETIDSNKMILFDVQGPNTEVCYCSAKGT